MILTGSILLFALVSAVRPYPFANLQPSGAPTFGYNQALLQQQQSQPFPFAVQPQLYSNQDPNRIQLYNDAQRFHQHQQLNQNPRFYADEQQQQQQKQPQQQHSIQQRQVPSEPTKAIQHPFYAGPNPQHQHARLAPTNVPTKAASPAAAPGKDFLSSLQIIDTQGRIRQLRDFGLGGGGNHPEEPELERQLKNIFDTIHRDLENAAFLPLDMHAGDHHQLGNIFQSNQYDRATALPDRTVQRPLESEERPRPPQAVDSRGHLYQQIRSQQPQQQQQQFQFLQPARANKAPESHIRSPAQTLRDAKNFQEKKQDEQRPIVLPLKQEHQADLPIKGPARIEQQPIQLQHQQQQQHKQQQQLHDDSKHQNTYKASTLFQQREPEPESKTRHQQQEPQRITLNQIKQEHQAPVEQQQITVPVQTETRPLQIDHQQQQGFDDEPTALKTVERHPTQTKEASNSRQRPVDTFKQVSHAREKDAVEQPVFDSAPISQVPFQQQKLEEIQQQQQQQPIPLPQHHQQQQNHHQQPQQLQQDVGEDDEPLAPASRSKTNSRKFDGWVPIVRKQVSASEEQKLAQPQAHLPLEQVKEELGFDGQRPVVQQKDAQIEQQKIEQVPTSAIGDASPIQQLDDRQQVPRGQGRFNKMRESVSKFDSPSKSKSNNNNNAGYQASDSQQSQQQQEKILVQEQQQREDIPVQQQEDALALVVEQQRQDIIQQRGEQDSAVGREQEQLTKTEQRRTEPTPVFTTTTTTTTSRPAQRNESVKGGRKVRLQQVEKVRTPVQKARDQQTKIIKQQQQIQQQQPEQQQQQQQQQEQQFQQLPQHLSKAAQREVKRPRQLQQAAKSNLKQEELQQVKEETQGQTNFEEPGTPVMSTFRQTPRNQERKKQQELLKEHRDDSIELPQQGQESPQQQEGQIRAQDNLTQQKEEESSSQQKEELGQQKVELPQPAENLLQQKEEVPQQREDQFNQKVDSTQERVETTQQKIEPVQQKDDTPQEMFDQTQQQKQQEPVSQQKEEAVNSQKEEPAKERAQAFGQKEEVNQRTEGLNQQTEIANPQTEEVTLQRSEESSKQKEEPSQGGDDLSQQSEDLTQQKEEVVQQQQTQEAPLQQQKQEEPVQQLQQQQQDNSAEQVKQQQDTLPQQPDSTQQQQTQEDSSQFQQTPQVSQQEQRQEDNISDQRQERLPEPAQEEEKRQDEQLQQQDKQTEEPETLNQEKQQIPELPQIQMKEAKTQNDDEITPTTTTRPPTRVVRPLNQKKEGKSRPTVVKQEAKEEVSQEVTVPTRPKSRLNQSNRLPAKTGIQRHSEQQSRGRFVARQKNDDTSISNSRTQSNNNEGYLSAYQLLNTYNPLQFEPERISSFNKATESSSQNTNVNSSPSGESY